jgi:non-ribosomal peptide synthetase component F
VRSYEGKRYSFTFSHEFSQGILALSRREGVTLFMVLLTAYNILLYLHSGQSDIVVGSMLADRMRAETEKLLGLFINPVALRTKIEHGTITFRELLHHVQTTTLAAYTYQDTPFQYVVEQSGLQPDPAYTPLFQVMLTLQDTSFSKGLEQIEGLTIEPLGEELVAWEAELAPCDLELHILEDTHGGLRGNLYYSTDLFMENTIQKLMEHFQSILKRVITNPEQQVQDL